MELYFSFWYVNLVPKIIRLDPRHWPLQQCLHSALTCCVLSKKNSVTVQVRNVEQSQRK
jgi:hypothetical protein